MQELLFADFDWYLSVDGNYVTTCRHCGKAKFVSDNTPTWLTERWRAHLVEWHQIWV